MIKPRRGSLFVALYGVKRNTGIKKVIRKQFWHKFLPEGKQKS